VRPPPRRGADAILCGRRRGPFDRLIRLRQPGRFALEDGQPEVLGRAVAVLERRSIAAPPVVVMRALAGAMRRVGSIRGSAAVGALAGGVALLDARATADELGQLVAVRGVGPRRPMLVAGFEAVDHRVEPRYDRRGERGRHQADPRRADLRGFPTPLGQGPLHAVASIYAGRPGSDWTHRIRLTSRGDNW
jgi:hypothetical protein